MPLQNFFTASYTGTRNNFTGAVGFKFTVGGSNVTVTALGRSVSTSIAASHTVKIWTEGGGSAVASATITSASPVDSLGYAYEMLAAPVVLTAGATYRIASNETSGGDKWRDAAATPSNTGTVTILEGVYVGTHDLYPSLTGSAAGSPYVPPTFYTGNIDGQPAALRGVFVPGMTTGGRRIIGAGWGG